MYIIQIRWNQYMDGRTPYFRLRVRVIYIDEYPYEAWSLVCVNKWVVPLKRVSATNTYCPTYKRNLCIYTAVCSYMAFMALFPYIWGSLVLAPCISKQLPNISDIWMWMGRYTDGSVFLALVVWPRVCLMISNSFEDPSPWIIWCNHMYICYVA